MFAVDSGEPVGAIAAVRGEAAVFAGTLGRGVQGQHLRVWWGGRILGRNGNSAVGLPDQGRTPGVPGHSPLVVCLHVSLSNVYLARKV